MKKKTIKYRRCAKCGKVIRYALIEDDGRDWMGHHWGEEKSYTVGYDCDCESSISHQDHLETNFNFKSQICTSRSQSERLLALGLKKETADMVWLNHAVTEEYEDWKATPMEEWDDWDKNSIPAWSLHRLIEMIDDECVIYLDNFTIAGRLFEVYDNLFDNIIDCIEWLIKEGYFNKEYLV